ncbi:sigma-54 interaction domain-containing protein [Oligoflexus tunisiensis]|uniref:sigma-54 interaction domain-containing protein n=1 Tax=Oligoflexus tunisiensis TaxID=708132 RepID=UPI00114CE891|nr:sigma-54 dependent transcriptional regulator [Oligoflexus tunisiensis]
MPLSYMPPAVVKNFQGMISSSPSMFQFFEMLKKAANTEAPVLIRGESGTGKELAARAIHTLSRRVQGPFHALNCATLTRELAISELFGHVKGAFTGASQNRKGLFEVSHKGSLFLDEIAEIPLDVQPRLLRVLQEQTFTALGSTTPKAVDVRLISATHESLRQVVEEQRFRADLMYRVRVIPLFLPPLRERGQDITMLAHRFLEQLNQNASRQVLRIQPKALEAMLSYPWPGNIRELRNVMEYAHVMGEGPEVTLNDLTPELRGESPPGTEDNIKSRERKSILDALEVSGGSRQEAAEKLGMSRATLWRKMREYRLG